MDNLYYKLRDWYFRLFPNRTIKKLLVAIPANGDKVDFKAVWSKVILNGREVEGFETFTAQWFCQLLAERDYIDFNGHYSDNTWFCNITSIGLLIKGERTARWTTLNIVLTAISVLTVVYSTFFEKPNDKELNNLKQDIQKIKTQVENLDKEILNLKKSQILKDSIQ